jgi:CubicO group peptidase (beta-lactamase class C family)
MRASIVGASVFLFLAEANVLAQSPIPEDVRAAVAKIDAMAAAAYGRDGVGGLTVGVVWGPRLVWTKSYGMADMEKQVPASEHTVYRIGSVTKPFTALMLLQLAQAGKVRMSDPVEKYFPEFSKIQGRSLKAPPVTLDHLATMRSGLAREPADPAPFMKGPPADWEKVLIAALSETKYAADPGGSLIYSNVGYAALGAALGRAADTPFVAYVQQQILAPLEMGHTAFELNDATRPTLAKGYEIGPAGKVSFDAPLCEHAGRGYKVPNGGLYSTVGDLARFVAFQLGEGPEAVLRKDTLEDTFKRGVALNTGRKSGYGVGFQVLHRGDLVAVGHSGSVKGYVAEVFFERGSRTGVIVLRNVTGGKFDGTDLALRALAELAQK